MKKICLSFGENCITDNILDRYRIKSFSTPFSSARSNIEYIIGAEKDNYSKFLSLENIIYKYNGEKKLPYLCVYNELKNHYKEGHMNGFEFTHHDVLNDPKALKSYKRKIYRLLNLKNTHIFIFYFHRYSPETNYGQLFDDLKELKNIYKKRGNNICQIIFFEQVIIDSCERRIENQSNIDLNIYRFYTNKIWEGDNPKYLFGLVDDDLINEFICDVCKKYNIRKNFLIIWLLRKTKRKALRFFKKIFARFKRYNK